MKTYLNFLLVLTVLVFGIVASGCQNPPDDLPADAYGRKGDPLPLGAKEISTPEFEAYMANGQIRLLNAAQEIADDQADRADREKNHAVVDAFLVKHPELTGRIKNTLDPKLAIPTGDGDFEALVKPGCTGTDCEKIRTLGYESKIAAVAGALTQFPLPANQIGIYAQMLGSLESYNLANPNNQIQTIGNYSVSKLPSVADVSQMTSEQRDQVLAIFGDSFAARNVGNLVIPKNPNYANPDFHLTHCENDVGVGLGLDTTSPEHGCNVFSATGVMANYNFQMKPYLTCVKNQGMRGTCWAFAATSMMEALYARDHQDSDGVPIYKNLSEQHLVSRVKLDWWPTLSSFGDGAGNTIIERMILENYRMPYENKWDYNQSLSRYADSDSQTYGQSCRGYSQTCSDFNHQAGLLCSYVRTYLYCGYVTQPADSTGGIRPTVTNQLWDWTNLDRSMALMILASVFNTPISVFIDVFPEFMEAGSTTRGWVAPPRHLSTDASIGQHVVHVVGYISNERIASIPALSAQLHDSTTGGGYFIIKNSWGTCKGDAGYYYVPAAWMREHTIAMMSLNGIE